MEAQTEKCSVVGVFRHESEELFPEYDDAILSVWQELIRTVPTRRYEHDGCSVAVNADFTPLPPMLETRRESMGSFRGNPQAAEDDWWKVFFESVQCHCTVSVSGANELSKHHWYPVFFAEAHLYDLFLILNIALPGSANFYSLHVSSADGRVSEDLNLSSFYFEEAWIASSSNTWPRLARISPSSVIEWFLKVRPSFNQIPENPVERALFALLHICRSDGRPEDIIWIFYAFESLFQTKTGENLNAIFDRLCLLLEPPSEMKSRLKKELRALYDYRSKFVHGGLQVIHPHHREVMDKRVDKQYGEILRLSIKWTHVLVACLQRMASEDWSTLKFETTLVAE